MTDYSANFIVWLDGLDNFGQFHNELLIRYELSGKRFSGKINQRISFNKTFS